MNPVRARMADSPAEYPWSSHRANAEGRADALVTPHSLVLALGSDPTTRSAGYCALFDRAPNPALIDDIRAATNGGYVLGSERFQREIAAATGRRTWRGLPGRPGKEPTDDRPPAAGLPQWPLRAARAGLRCSSAMVRSPSARAPSLVWTE
jgi:putative transposase